MNATAPAGHRASDFASAGIWAAMALVDASEPTLHDQIRAVENILVDLDFHGIKRQRRLYNWLWHRKCGCGSGCGQPVAGDCTWLCLVVR